MDELRITLNIAGKSYQFDIARADEALYRQAAKDINRLVAQYEVKLDDKVDCLALSALSIAMDGLRTRTASSLTSEIGTLEAIGARIDDYLNKLG